MTIHVDLSIKKNRLLLACFPDQTAVFKNRNFSNSRLSCFVVTQIIHQAFKLVEVVKAY